MMKIKITKQARKGMNKLPKKLQAKFRTAFDMIADGDTESLNFKKLQGEETLYRLRIGGYRALFDIIDDVIVIKVGPRGDFYKGV